MNRSTMLSAAAVCALAVVALAPARAGAETVDLGDTADVDLVDIEGTADGDSDVEIDQEWTIGDLRPSTDVIPHRVAGTLWEATATVELADGGVPVMPGFFARSEAGNYPLLWEVPSAQGVNPASLPPAGSATGKFYFDVTGPAPTSVAFLDVEGDLVEWRVPAG